MSSKEIVKKTDIASFYGLDSFNIAVKASNFDVLEEVNTIIQLIRDPDPKVALPALKHFRTILKDVATTNGVIGNVEQSIRYDDKDQNAIVRQSVTSQKLLNTMKEHNERDEKSSEEESSSSKKSYEALPAREVQ